MKEKITVTCPRCGHKWLASLNEGEKINTVYSSGSDDSAESRQNFRLVCPIDGTFFTVEISNLNSGEQARLLGDSTVDAPPPAGDVKKKKRNGK